MFACLKFQAVLFSKNGEKGEWGREGEGNGGGGLQQEALLSNSNKHPCVFPQHSHSLVQATSRNNANDKGGRRGGGNSMNEGMRTGAENNSNTLFHTLYSLLYYSNGYFNAGITFYIF